MSPWLFFVALVVALFRPPRSDVWWAWVIWLFVLVALMSGAFLAAFAGYV